jgi:hypothetical protein
MHGDTNESFISSRSEAQKDVLVRWLKDVYGGDWQLDKEIDLKSMIKMYKSKQKQKESLPNSSSSNNNEPETTLQTVKQENHENIHTNTNNNHEENAKGNENNNNNSNSGSTNDSAVRLCVLEIGCGVSLHSISIESEMLVREDKNNTTRLIRINPTNPRVPPGGKF